MAVIGIKTRSRNMVNVQSVNRNQIDIIPRQGGGGGGSCEYCEELAQFFGLPEALPSGYEFMTDTEVTDELEDIMQALDPELEQEVEYPEGSGTYITKAQAITAEAMQIINHSQS